MYISPIISQICISVIELGLLLKILKNYIFEISLFQIYLHIYKLKSYLMLELIVNLDGFYVIIYENAKFLAL